MANPTPFAPSYDFSDFAAENPATPLPGDQVDIQFSALQLTTDELIAALSNIRRSDGALANGVVTPDSLSAGLVMGFTVEGEWTNGAEYGAADGVSYGTSFYKARVAHTASPSTRPDLSPDTWAFLFTFDSIAVGDNSVTTTKIVNGAVTEAKIADGAVTEAKIASSAVTSAKIATDAITTVKIADAQVLASKLAPDAVTTAKILDANVTAAKLATDAVSTAKVAAEAITAAKLAPSVAPGKVGVWIDAGAFVPQITNGPAAGIVELATNKQPQLTLDFDQTTQEFAVAKWVPPKRWNLGTLTFVPYWTAAAGTAAQTVIFQLEAVAIRNDDPLDAAYGTAQSSSDALIATGDCHIGPESSAITPAGTLAAADFLWLRIKRDMADTLAADAKLLGIMLFFTANAGNDA
jgi:hypothetical protein